MNEIDEGNFYCSQCNAIFSPEFNPTDAWFDKFICPVCKVELIWSHHSEKKDRPVWWFVSNEAKPEERQWPEEETSPIRVEIIER